jgi:hypothetical protein
MISVQSSYSECIRAARDLVSRDYLESLKTPRPNAIYRATVLLWLQLILSWALALSFPLWLAPVSFLVNSILRIMPILVQIATKIPIPISWTSKAGDNF